MPDVYYVRAKIPHSLAGEEERDRRRIGNLLSYLSDILLRHPPPVQLVIEIADDSEHLMRVTGDYAQVVHRITVSSGASAEGIQGETSE